MIETSLFFRDVADEAQLIFLAGFHMGIPVSIIDDLCKPLGESTTYRYCSDNAFVFSPGHDTISSDLNCKFQESGKFDIILQEYAPSVTFPLGKPLIIRYRNFNGVFRWKELSEYASDNLIWICPSGVVLVMGRVRVPTDFKSETRELFDAIVESQMPQLTYVFSEVAEIILKACSPETLDSVRCCHTDIKKCKNAIEIRLKYPELINGTKAQWEKLSCEEEKFLIDVLIDIYYIDFCLDLSCRNKQPKDLKISYIDSSIYYNKPQYLLIIAIAYSSFVGLLAFQKFFGEKVRMLHSNLLKRTKTNNSASAELKLLGAFCLEFIDESEPTRIHLMGHYMECISECWKEFRMFELSDQVRRQISTLDKMVEWIDQQAKEDRNLRIGIAAVVLALISIVAVAAQLISTLDVSNQIGWQDRLLFILLGFILGIACTVAIVYFPVAKLSPSFKRLFLKT
jgi:hypothetical protein